MSSKNRSAWLHVLESCAAAWLSSCAAPPAGPKLVEADGARYTSCSGATWLRDDGNSKDPATMTYEVLFKDPQGVNRDLKMVRVLRITNLPEDTSVCKNSAARASAPGAH